MSNSGRRGSQSQLLNPLPPCAIEQLKTELSKVSKRLEKSTGSIQKGTKSLTPLDESDMRDLFNGLKDALSYVLLEMEKAPILLERIETLESDSRRLNDESDHHHQRSLKGKFFISSSKTVPLLRESDLEESGENLPDYVCRLLLQKYAIEAQPSDFKTCHYTRTGIIVRFLNLSPVSPYDRLVRAIKGGKGKEVNTFFFNFSLTARRSSLLFELRKLKKSKDIEKFYSDSDGAISYILNENDVKKVRVTSMFVRVGSSTHIKTLTNDELLSSFPDA